MIFTNILKTFFKNQQALNIAHFYSINNYDFIL